MTVTLILCWIVYTVTHRMFKVSPIGTSPKESRRFSRSYIVEREKVPLCWLWTVLDTHRTARYEFTSFGNFPGLYNLATSHIIPSKRSKYHCVLSSK